MTENTIEYEMNGDDLKLLTDKLVALREKSKPYPPVKLTETEVQTLKDIAYTLSSVLPKVSDASLFEVDDLIYPDNDFITNKPNISRTYSENTKNLIIKSWHANYYYVYLRARRIQENAMSRILDTTFLQIVEHLPIKSEQISVNCLLTPVEMLLRARQENKLCQALKLLNIALDKHKEHVMGFLKHRYDQLRYIPMYIQRFQNIPKAKHHDKQQIIAWISSQVAKFLAKLEEKDIKFPHCMKHIRTFDILEKEEYFSVKFVRDMFKQHLSEYKTIPFDLLYSFFMSAKNEEKKLERLKHFIIGISGLDESVRNYRASFLINFSQVPSLFEKYIQSISDLGYTDDQLRDIDKYHDYKIEPYLNDTSPIESNNEQSDENLNDSEIPQNEIPDYTIERFLFYDDFMRKLHVLNIVHTAFMMTPTFFNVRESNCMPGIDSEVFRYSFVIKKIINKSFFNPSKDGNIPWLIETILKKCPFLIFSKNNEHMKDDLIKLLKGEKIDKILEEELFYVINATGSHES